MLKLIKVDFLTKIRAICPATLFCLMWLSPDVSALNPTKSLSQYKQVLWNTENGLPTNLVTTMVQTRDGYLWFGTQEGLARFNGATFKIFDAVTAPTLKSDHIPALLEDRAGRLWVGTLKGLHLYQNGEFTAYTTEQGLSRNYISALYEDRRGNLWIGTSGGLNQMLDGKIVSYGARAGLSNDRIRAISEDADGNLWIGTADGLFRFRDNEFKLFTVSDGLASNSIREIYFDSNKALWIGTDGGLSKLKSEQFVTDARFVGKTIRTIVSDKENCLWVGGNFGLSRINGNQIATLESEKSLLNGGAYSILADDEGSLWVSTEGGGALQFTDGKFTTYTTAEGLVDNVSFSIHQNEYGDIWISTQKGLSRFRQNNFDLTLTKQQGIPTDRVNSVISDRAGDLWIGTVNGLSQWQNNNFASLRGGEKLQKKIVQALYQDPDHNVWIGTNNGLSRFNNQLNNGEVIEYNQFEQLASANIYTISGSLSKGLWIGTLKGLFLLKDDKLTLYTTKDGLANDTVMSLYEDAAGALWIGTYGAGLSRFKNDKFNSISTRDGLFNAIIYSILPDDKNNLWMSCNRGIFRVDKTSLDEFMDGNRKTVESVVYGTADGMKAFECNGGFQPASLKARDGKLWFPTIKGVAVVDPNNIPINQRPPPVHLENIVADAQPVSINEKADLPAGTQRLEFQFSALSFVAPERVRFRYRLDGYDDDWIDAGNRREAFYTNLPHGDYTFRVIAGNNDGVWNETGANFQLHVNPFFYQTWWFALLCIVGTSGVITATHFWRVKQLQLRHNAVLTERTRIARELHDTLLQGFVGVSSQLSAVAEQFQDAPEIAERHLDVARKMIRHSVTESRRAVQNLRTVESNNQDFGQMLRETVSRVAEGQSLKTDFEINGIPFKIAPEVTHHLLRIAEEAVINTIKHADAKTVKIVFSYDQPVVRLGIIDDGRGFDDKNAFSILNGHFGLLGMKERAENVGGKLFVESVANGGTKVVFESKRAALNGHGAVKPT